MAPEFDEYPRTRMLPDEPGRPVVLITCTPLVFPASDWARLLIVRFSKSEDFNDAIAPVTSDFLWTP